MDLDRIYRDIVETSTDGIWVLDLEGRTIYANPAMAALYGVPHREVGRVTVFDTLDDVGRAQFHEHLQRVRVGETNEAEVEVLFHRRDGSAVWILVRESLLRDAAGAVTGMLHRFSDYTERRNQLEALASSQAQLREAQRIARLGTWTWDTRAGVMTYTDGTAHDGESERAFVMRSSAFSGRLLAVHPDDRERVSTDIRQILAEHENFELDARIAVGPGWRWTRVRGVVTRDVAGAVVRLAGTHQDVSEEKSVEDALRDEINQSAFMRTVSVAANEARSISDVLALARPALLAHDDWERVCAFVVDQQGRLVSMEGDATADEAALAERARQAGHPIWSADRLTIGFPIRLAERTFGVATITSAPPLVRHEMIENMVAAVAVQLGRVAEREEAQRVLAAARDAAMDASKQKSEFLATMSHEIRTPLNGIIGLNDLMLRTTLAPDQQRLASGVRMAAKSLLDVISDVLDFSKIDEGQLEIESVDLEVRPLLDQVIQVVGGTALSGAVELIVSCLPDVPTSGKGDPTRLSQVLLNLLSNAVKFTPRGDVLLQVSVDSRLGEQVLLRFEVRDTGIGIQPGQVDRLFDPFTQADASTTRRFGGTGLGLAIAKEIVAGLGGRISYAPNPGGGSIFAFTAPLTHASMDANALDDHARARLARRRILLVDSHATRAPALAEQLDWWQCRTAVVADPDLILPVLHQAEGDGDPYESIIISIDDGAGDGAGDGLELMRRIDSLRTPAALPVIVLTPAGVDLPVSTTQSMPTFMARPLAAEQLRLVLLEQLAGVSSPLLTHAPDLARATHGRRILVVEDNPVNQLVATGILEAMGHTVQVAPHGADALEYLGQGTYDAVLMDVQMPVMDGYEATRTLRERETGADRIPVIAMTAAVVDGERERCLDAGMDDFLTKPVDPTSLAAVLDRWTNTDVEPRPARDLSPTPPSPSPLMTVPESILDLERLSMLRELDPGDTSYLERAIANFQVNSKAAVEAIVQHLAIGDVPAIKFAAHKIAGSALNLGLTRAGEAARAVELAMEEGATTTVDELVPELVEAMTEGRRLLLDYQTTHLER